MILDEAQNIKNADSRHRAGLQVAAERTTRLALTGTPLENRLSRAVEHLRLPHARLPRAPRRTSASATSSRSRWRSDVDARERLRRRIQPFILRRLKTEVAKDLPPKTETVAYCEMEPGQAALYREVLEESRRKVYDSIEKVGFKRSRVSILAALMRLRQVCCDPRLLKLPPGDARCRRRRSWSASTSWWTTWWPRVTARWSSASSPRCCELLKAQADERKLAYLYLDGRTKDRMARVDEFNRPDGPPLFFISLKAGGTGLNLTAADYVIHYDPWWNPAVEDQATDRTHRIGQTRGGHQLQAHHPRHGGGEDPRAAAAEAGAGRGRARARTAGCRKASPSRTSKTCSRRSRKHPHRLPRQRRLTEHLSSVGRSA